VAGGRLCGSVCLFQAASGFGLDRRHIRQMARDNPTWGQERIANELLLKLGLRVSPRTVRTYMPKRLDRGPGSRVPSQRWQTFVRNHAKSIVACDFCVAMTATFRILYQLPDGRSNSYAKLFRQIRPIVS
jgi:hypothetical protein